MSSKRSGPRDDGSDDSDDHDHGGDGLRARALEEAREGRPNKARRFLNAAIGNAPRNADNWFELGQLERNEGNQEQAVDAFTRVLQLAPDSRQATRALEQLGVDPATVAAEPEDVDPEPPASLERTEAYDWDLVEKGLIKVGAYRLEGLIDPGLLGDLDATLAGRPGVPLEEGVSEHLLAAPPPELAPWVTELLYRGDCLNRAMRGLLSGPMLGASKRVLGAAGVFTLAMGAEEFRWPRALGDSPFPLELALPLGGDLHLDLSDAVSGKKGKVRRPIEASVGDAVLLGAGERPVLIGGVWGRQGLVVRIVARGEQRVLRLRVG